MENEIQRIVAKNKIKYLIVSVALIILIFLMILISVSMGAMKIGTGEIIQIITSKIFNLNCNIADNVVAVVWKIRLPRIICAIFVGIGLAVSGVIFQAILQNPLADPYTIGISTGASFGASVSIILNLIWGFYFPTTIAALIGALATLIIVIIIARKGESLDGSNIIIAGIIISSILSSGVSFIKMLAGENVGAIVFWIMGSLSAKGWNDVNLLVPTVLIGVFISIMLSRQLDIMSLGDFNASALGVDTNKIRFIYLIIGSVLTAICVSVSGVIGFIGLIVPHLLRFWLTAENKILIPLSALFGGLLLLCADSITRIFANGEIPVGVLTTIIGGPFFIFVFTRKGGYKNG